MMGDKEHALEKVDFLKMGLLEQYSYVICLSLL